MAREERQRRKQEADRCAALFSASLCRSVIKTFKLKATGLPVLFLSFFFFWHATDKGTFATRVTAEDSSMKSVIFCSIV